MKTVRLLAVTMIACFGVLAGGAELATAGGFEDTEIYFDTHATADFGLGETAYRAVGTVPAMLKEDPHNTMFTAYVAGLRYDKVDPTAPGPAYFDITDGTFKMLAAGDLDEGTIGVSSFMWDVELITDGGDEYQSSGMILDLFATDVRDVWRWTGPIIEP